MEVAYQHRQAYSEGEDQGMRPTPVEVEEIEGVAGHLVKIGVTMDEVIHSGRVRTGQTAEIFAWYLKAPVREGDDLAQKDNPSLLVERLNKYGGEVMLVGHLPDLSRLTSSLPVGNPDAVKFSYSGVAKLAREGGWLGTSRLTSWDDLV